MKRILTIVMCAIMLVGAMAFLTGCEEDKNPTQPSTTTTTTQSATTTTKQNETTTTTEEQTTTVPATTTTTTKQETTVTTKNATTTTTKKPTTTTTTKKTTTSTTVQGVIKEKDAFIGSWSTKLDMTKELNDAYNESDLKGYVVISDFSFKMIFTFKQNDTYSIRIDENAARTMYNKVRTEYENGVRKYFADLLEENDVDMTVDEYLESEGTNMKEIVDYEYPIELLDYMISGYKTDGRFEVENGICYMNYDLEAEIDKTDTEQYDPYTISGNTLTFYANGEGEENVTLTKIN